jgi:transposase
MDDDAKRDEDLRWLQLTVEFLQRQVTSLSHQVQERGRQIRRLEEENRLLRQRLVEQQQPPPPPPPPPPQDPPAPPPPFVKPPVGKHRRKRPGRKAGHQAALRPPPPKIDRTVDVPLPRGQGGRPACPCCAAALRKLKRHARLVEDLVPATVLVTRYRTHSGWCPQCRRRVESRAPEQPPAADVPHAQLGLNALATVAMLRLANRLPMRQVTQWLADGPGLRLCAGAVARQLQRLGDWLGGEWQSLQRRVRAASAVHADETAWRTAGRNQWLWTLCDPRHTLYHVDASRGGRVVRRLLGGAFGGTLVSDFYSAYNTVRCPQQKCLTHLLRELRETAARSPPFAAGVFYRRGKRLAKDLLAHKRRWDELDDQAYTDGARRLERRLAALADAHRRDATADPDTRRLAERLWRHRDQLTAFLWEREVDGTNNAAERALRPIVVARKVSGGSRSAAGARATAVVASVLRTARQQGRNVLATLKQLLVNSWAGGQPGTLLA